MSAKVWDWTQKILWKSVELDNLQFAENPARSISGFFRRNASGFTDWPHKTPEEIYRDVRAAQSCCYIANQEDLYGIGDRILLPPDLYRYILETPAPPYACILEGLRLKNFGIVMWGFDESLGLHRLPFEINIKPDPTVKDLVTYVGDHPYAGRFTGYWR